MELLLLFKSLLVISKVVDSTLPPMEREFHTVNAVPNVENVFKQVESSGLNY